MSRIWVLFLIIISFAGIAIMYSCTQHGQRGDSSFKGKPVHNTATFVGDEKCKNCHSKAESEWMSSDHERAMAKATDESVEGNFSGTTFTHKGATYRFYREGDKFKVKAPGPNGKPTAYQITYTFGWTPLQQYLVDFGKGKLQVLNVAWDTQKKHWFSLYPDQKINPDDWLHWTNGAMNWNTMCADCHSTDLKQNYHVQADSFHTTWSSINVSCEACHGPGSVHVKFMKSQKGKQASVDRIRHDLKMTGSTSQKILVNECARCHSRREKLTAHYDHGKKFMDQFAPVLPHPANYFSDGQIKEEDYTYSSFLQSKMFHKGVRCTNCHNPHTLKLRAKLIDNSLCLQCHASSYNSPKHYFHKPNTKASMCVSCHMPGRYYMQVDFRRDHSLRIPRPDLSVKFGTPNACNNCHSDKSAEWTAKAVVKWYGPDRPDHFSTALIKASEEGPKAMGDLKSLIADTSQPAIARATAIWYLGQFPDQESMSIFKNALESSSPLIRNSATKAIASLPAEQKKLILPAVLNDSVLAVRLSAAEELAEFSPADFAPDYRQSFRQALDQYKQKLNANQYFPQGQMNRGQFYEKQGQITKAIHAYQKALDKDSAFIPARINLAYLMNRQGNNAKAKELFKTVIAQEPDYGPVYYSMGLLLAQEKNLKKAVTYFSKAASGMPQNDRVRYNWAIALQNLNRPEKAAQAYLEAIKLAPRNPDYRYGICTLYIQQKEYDKALMQAQKFAEFQPNNPKAQQLLDFINKKK